MLFGKNVDFVVKKSNDPNILGLGNGNDDVLRSEASMTGRAFEPPPHPVLFGAGVDDIHFYLTEWAGIFDTFFHALIPHNSRKARNRNFRYFLRVFPLLPWR